MPGRILIKVTPEDDFYVLWTTVADGPLRWGTREQLSTRLPVSKMLTEPFNPGHMAVDEPSAFHAADIHGSATLLGDPGYFDWDSSEELFFIWEGEPSFSGTLTRESFRPFMEILPTLRENGDELKPLLIGLEA